MVSELFTILEDPVLLANDPLQVCNSSVKQFYTAASASNGGIFVGDTCTADSAAFLSPLIREGYDNTTNEERKYRFALVADLQQNQDYWIDILEVSIISDLVMAFAQFLILIPLRFSRCSSTQVAKTILGLNIVVVIVGISLSVVVLYFVVVDPVRYDSTMALVYDGINNGNASDVFQGVAYVKPNEKHLQLGTDGSFFIGSGPVLGTITRCADNITDIVQQEAKMAFEVISTLNLAVGRNFPRIQMEGECE